MSTRSFFLFISNILAIRIFFVCLFFLQSLLIFSQSSTTKYIDSKEKKRLENEFQALGDYYIDDSGLVVYKANSEVKVRETGDSKSVKSNSSMQDFDNQQIEIYQEAQELTEPEKKSTVVEIVEEDDSPALIDEYKETNIQDKPQFYYNNRQNQDLGVKDKKNTPTRESVPIKTDEESVIVVDRTPQNKQKEATTKRIATSKTKEVSPQLAPKKIGDGGSVLNRRRQSQYKNMEEAALAVEALIENLKKEQATYTNSGSMSSRLSRGVTKDLRKKSGISNQQISTTYEEEKSEPSSDFDTEPSYFINGVQVDKTEINKLRKIDIVNREIRVRNTVTGNPNGEIWYEVKKDALTQP